jgi:murein DD-endopeptidase MepM/ murein hydrolase activator NlpD
MIFEGYKITSHFGKRLDPFTKKETFHTGIDLVKKHKSAIYSFTDGVVHFAGDGLPGSGFGGFGNVVAVLDKNGALHCYCHLHSVNTKKGNKVEIGTVLGTQGSTGRSTGSHLHYEVRKTHKIGNGWRKGTEHVFNPGEYLKSLIQVKK